MRNIKRVLWSIIFCFIFQLIAGMFIVIWNKDLIGDIFAKIWVTLALLSFFSLCALAKIDEVQKKTLTQCPKTY